jgi:hypothetical protein
MQPSPSRTPSFAATTAPAPQRTEVDAHDVHVVDADASRDRDFRAWRGRLRAGAANDANDARRFGPEAATHPFSLVDRNTAFHDVLRSALPGPDLRVRVASLLGATDRSGERFSVYVEVQDSMGNTPLMLALKRHPDDVELFKLLMPPPPNEDDDAGTQRRKCVWVLSNMAVLAAALERNCRGAVEALLPRWRVLEDAWRKNCMRFVKAAAARGSVNTCVFLLRELPAG